MRWLLAFAATTLTLVAGAWYTTTNPPSEGSMECHGVVRGYRCVQFRPNPQVTKLVAAMTALPRHSPLSDVSCYSKGSLAVCDATFNHGSLGVADAPFRIQADGTVTPVCHRGGRKRATTAFCSDRTDPRSTVMSGARLVEPFRGVASSGPRRLKGC